jgi:hypothetical protein
MSRAALLDAPARPQDAASGRLFAAAGLALAVPAALLAGWAPLGFSIATVFLFAGPHNWIEARYFLARLPARWGKLRGFFLLAFAGIFGLTAVYAALPWLAEVNRWDHQSDLSVYAAWNSALVLWIATLIHLRSRQNPRRDWSWTWAVAFGVLALVWIAPPLWGLALVYLHPLMALWILDRELRRSRPEWRRPYHLCLACLPLLLGLLWWRLADTPNLPGDDAYTVRITRHAGAGILDGISTHLLVATHTFLEMIHYGVWLVAVPLVGLRGNPWRLHTVPLARRSPGWRFVVVGILATGVLIVLGLWACFLANYPLTRDVYFTVALLHVLAEVPFLLRAL